MAATSRSALLTKIHKALKKHYKPIVPPADRPLMESMIYALCLENATAERADEVFARLQQLYFDWNEVRVTTVGELSEVMARLPEAKTAATNVKQFIQSVFETHYAFDQESLKKMAQGKAVAELEGLKGVTPFSVAYVTQNSLGGHSIPVDDCVLDLLAMLNVITPAEREKNAAPGLERAIPKSKGVEFGSMLHQLAAEFRASPHSTKLRNILTEIDSDVKERLPKRPTAAEKAAAKKAEAEEQTAVQKKAAAKKARRKRAQAKEKSASESTKKSSSKKLTKRKPR